jgi:hypothetical protein
MVVFKILYRSAMVAMVIIVHTYVIRDECDRQNAEAVRGKGVYGSAHVRSGHVTKMRKYSKCCDVRYSIWCIDWTKYCI